MDLEDFVSRLDGVKRQPSGISARCPNHDDHVASLSVDNGRHGNIVLKCHAGCQAADVVVAMGLTMSDLAGRPHRVATYVYTSDDGQPIYAVERWHPKDFKCVPGLPPVAQRRLYQGHVLKWARERGAHIYLCEGEKDCDRLRDLGLVGTTNPGGAGKFYPHYGEQVAGCVVTVVADNDEPGRAHAREVARLCAPFAASVTTTLPRYGKDLSQLLDLGWTLDALDPLPASEGLAAISAANVITRPVTWAWPGYVPLGAVTILEGDPGDGKSIMSTDLAARWSSGAPMPDGQRHDGPCRVLMVSAEDDLACTVVPRLRAGGADLHRVELVTQGSDPAKPFTFSTDMPALARHVLDHDVKVVIFDPLMAFLGDETDSHNDHAVRRALFPLFRLAQDTACAVLVIRHLNKGQGKAVYRGGGSIAFIGASRAAYTIGRDPEDPARRVFANVKMNIAVTPPSLAYSIVDSAKGPFLEWHGAIDANAQDIVDGRRTTEDPEILSFLNTIVEEKPMTWKEIVRAGSLEGWTEGQLRTRRHRSRLVKVVGEEGARSIRWGYLDHQVNVETRLHTPPPFTPFAPTSMLSETSPTHVNGPTADASVPRADPLPDSCKVQTAANGENGGVSEQTGSIDGDSDPDVELDALPLECQICGASEQVNRYAHPWWVVRCLPHSPITYRE